MEIKRLIHNNMGLSVIELLIALTLLGIILALGFSYFVFGANTFRIGEAQSNLQRDIRLTSNFITREVRYATDLDLLDNVNSPLWNDYNYLYLDNNSVIKHIDGNGNEITKSENIIELLSFNLNIVNEKLLLEFIIEGSNDSQHYNQKSEVVLVNIKLTTGDINVENKPVLRYKNP